MDYIHIISKHFKGQHVYIIYTTPQNVEKYIVMIKQTILRWLDI